MGKVELVLVRRRVRAVIETELAVVTLIDYRPMVGGSQVCNLSLIPVDTVQQGVERRTEVETAAAAVADFINAQRFLVQLRRLDRIDKTESFHIINSFP